MVNIVPLIITVVIITVIIIIIIHIIELFHYSTNIRIKLKICQNIMNMYIVTINEYSGKNMNIKV